MHGPFYLPFKLCQVVRAFALQRLQEHARAHEEMRCLRDTQVAYLLLRYSLAVRIHYLLRLVGSEMAPHEEGPQAPIWVHDEQMALSLAALLVDPTQEADARSARMHQRLPAWVVAQAGLPAARGTWQV